MHSLQRLIVLAPFCTLLLVGCGGDRSELEAWVAEVRARPAQELDTPPTMREFESFPYEAQGLRDPFSDPIAENAGAAKGPSPDPSRRKELLESYPLDSLSMVGTLNSGNQLVGLVVDPQRVVHRVRPGNYMGQSDGRIIGVYEDRIELAELVADGAGGWLPRDATIALDDTEQ